MAILSVLPIIGPIIEKAVGVVDQLVPDGDLREKLKNEIQTKMMTLDYSVLEKEIDAKAKIIVAEAQGHSWLQRNWRPVLMLTIVAIIANNYVVYPYLSLVTDKAGVLELPNSLYNLMAVGVGGYVVGRSGEKIVQSWKGKS
jgi:predicted MFS family arabinose efflux permease